MYKAHLFTQNSKETLFRWCLICLFLILFLIILLCFFILVVSSWLIFCLCFRVLLKKYQTFELKFFFITYKLSNLAAIQRFLINANLIFRYEAFSTADDALCLLFFCRVLLCLISRNEIVSIKAFKCKLYYQITCNWEKERKWPGIGYHENELKDLTVNIHINWHFLFKFNNIMFGFRTPLCILFRLNWIKPTQGTMRLN